MSTDKEVALEILSQLGGNRFLAMTGARIVGFDAPSLSFRLPKARLGIKHVKVALDPSDTYTVTFTRIGRAPARTVTVVHELEGVYADQLVEIFESTTGLYTHL